jgi:integrase
MSTYHAVVTANDGILATVVAVEHQQILNFVRGAETPEQFLQLFPVDKIIPFTDLSAEKLLPNIARLKLRAMMGAPGRPQEPSIDLAELVDRWLATVGPTLRESTKTHYTNALKSIKPHFQCVRVRDIDRYTVERFLLGQSARYSRSTLRSFRTSLSIIFGWAEANGWIAKNPVRGVKLPRECGGREITRHALNRADVDRLTRELAEPYATLCSLLHATGLRISEALGLQWGDLRDNAITVERRLYEGKLGEVKSRGSRRRLPLPREMVERLLKLKPEDGAGFVFHCPRGAPLSPTNVRNRHLKPTAKKLGISISGFHDFRHTRATELRRQGVHPKLVSAALGHSKVQLALELYDHVSASDLEKAFVPDGTQPDA